MPSPPIVPLLAAIIVGCLVLYHYIIYPALLSPLAKIPHAHPTAGISAAWITWMRYQERENKTIHTAHGKFGPVVRLGPNEVSVNSYEGGLRTIYAGGFEKHAFYPNQFENFGVPNMFSTAYSKPHSIRKRMLTYVYSKSYLLSSPSMASLSHALIYERLLPEVQKLATTSAGEINVYKIVNNVTMDFITAYQFGLCNSSNFIQDEADASTWFKHYLDRRQYGFWPQELPELPAFLAKIGIHVVPGWVAESNKYLGDWSLNRCDLAAKFTAYTKKDVEKLPENIPIVYQQLKNALESNGKSAKQMTDQDLTKQRLVIASEMHDHLAAGQETSGITLTYLFWELSRNQRVQDCLRTELQTLSPKIQLRSDSSTTGIPELPAAKDIDALPLLDAILQETLRLHAAIPGAEPRVTPSSGAVLGPPGHSYVVPGYVRVSSQPYTMHRIPSVFPSAESWTPERWFLSTASNGSEQANTCDEERLKDMHRNFWAFSSGGRGCIGKHFATIAIKLVVAALVSRFKIQPVEGGDVGIQQQDAYTAQPEGHRLILKFEAVSELS